MNAKNITASLVIAWCAAGSSAQSLDGRVELLDGRGLPGVVVEIAGSPYRTVTDGSGAWSISGPVGVGARGKPRGEVVRSRLGLESGRLRLSQAGNDLVGRRLREAEAAPRQGPVSAREADAIVVDTLVYSYRGRPFEKDTLWSTVQSGLLCLFDTMWMESEQVIRLGMTDSRDGKVYGTAWIGAQHWMTENLDHVTPRSNYYSGEECIETCQPLLYPHRYGRFYDWAEAMALPDSCNAIRCRPIIDPPRIQGVCMPGWHLPSDSEWVRLFRHVDSIRSVGANHEAEALQARSAWNHGTGRDLVRFRALPGGNRYENGTFYGAGDYGNWWTSTEDDPKDARSVRMVALQSSVVLRSYYKNLGYNVRCVED